MLGLCAVLLYLGCIEWGKAGMYNVLFDEDYGYGPVSLCIQVLEGGGGWKSLLHGMILKHLSVGSAARRTAMFTWNQVSGRFVAYCARCGTVVSVIS